MIFMGEQGTMSMKGKIVVVTGGSGGLGRAVVRTFLSAGASVHVFERSKTAAEKRLSDEGTRITIHETDVLDEGSLGRAFDEVVEARGRVDVLVNTVGGFLGAKPLAEVSLEEWNRMMKLNLTSAFLSSREFLRRSDRSYGRIFNISAMVGLVPAPGKVPYALSKAGVSLLTELLAGELKDTGITVHAFAPGIIVTDANREAMPEADTSAWVKPESIAEMMLALCSDGAGSFSGTTIRAFGGI